MECDIAFFRHYRNDSFVHETDITDMDFMSVLRYTFVVDVGLSDHRML